MNLIVKSSSSSRMQVSILRLSSLALFLFTFFVFLLSDSTRCLAQNAPDSNNNKTVKQNEKPKEIDELPDEARNITTSDLPDEAQNITMEVAPAAVETENKKPSDPKEMFKRSQAIAALVDGLLNKTVYSKTVRPYYGGPPVHVNVTVVIYAISKVDEFNMEITYNLNFQQQWNDPRLAFKPIDNITWIYLTADTLPKIWRPDARIIDTTDFQDHSNTILDGSTGVSRFNTDGDVEYNISMTVTKPCQMYLNDFPADQQTCKFVIASAAFGDSDIVFHWSHRGLDVWRFLQTYGLPNHIVTSFDNRNFSGLSFVGPKTWLQGSVKLQRRMSYYVYQIYVPSFLVVVISWIPFWLERDHHARVGLGVTTVLTITTLITNTMTTLPKVSYIKSLDVYLFTSFCMVFLSLIEYAIVGYFEAKGKNKLEEGEDKNSNSKPEADLENQDTITKVLKQPSKIDKISRGLFPAVFFAFNIYYIYHIRLILEENRREAEM